MVIKVVRLTIPCSGLSTTHLFCLSQSRYHALNLGGAIVGSFWGAGLWPLQTYCVTVLRLNIQQVQGVPIQAFRVLVGFHVGLFRGVGGSASAAKLS